MLLLCKTYLKSVFRIKIPWIPILAFPLPKECRHGAWFDNDNESEMLWVCLRERWNSLLWISVSHEEGSVAIHSSFLGSSLTIATKIVISCKYWWLISLCTNAMSLSKSNSCNVLNIDIVFGSNSNAPFVDVSSFLNMVQLNLSVTCVDVELSHFFEYVPRVDVHLVILIARIVTI